MRAVRLTLPMSAALKGIGSQALLITVFANLDRAIRLEPKRAEHYLRRGLGHREVHDADRANLDFDQAVKLEPRNAAALKQRRIGPRETANVLPPITTPRSAVGG